MKNRILNTTILLAVLTIGITLLGCKGGSSSKEENFDKDASYALGMTVGMSLVADGIVPNMNEFVRGIKETASGKEPRFNEYEAMMKIQAAYETMMTARQAELMGIREGALADETVFFTENRQRAGVFETPSGLQYEIISETSGRRPQEGDVVKVHYEGRFTDGEVFDSSYSSEEPPIFFVGDIPGMGVIPGMIEGFQIMTEGSKYRFFIPSDLGYGPSSGNGMRPFATLIFDIELFEVMDSPF